MLYIPFETLQTSSFMLTG